MSSTNVLTVKESGDLTLPAEIVGRYQIEREMQFRIIETKKGVLLIPLTDEPMNGELKAEIEEWQVIGGERWVMFEIQNAGITK